MARYDIYFAGEIAQGADLEKVKPQLGKMLKINSAQLERLFSGKAVRIKAGVDEATAVKYRNALQKAGAVVQIRKSKVPQPPTVQNDAPEQRKPPAPPARQISSEGSTAAGRAVFGEVEDSRPPPPVGRATFGDEAEMAAPPSSAGRTSFGETSRVASSTDADEEGGLTADANFDSIEELPDNRATSIEAPEGELDFDVLPANTGSLEEFAEEDIPMDLSDIDDSLLLPRGTELDQSKPEPVVEISTGDLTVGPPNSGSLEDCAEDESGIPLPDISKLKLAD